VHQRRPVEKSQVDFMGQGVGQSYHLSCHGDAETRDLCGDLLA